MILNNPDQHLSDKDFFVFASFQDKVLRGMDSEQKHIPLYTFALGLEESAPQFKLLFTTLQLLDITVRIEIDHRFSIELSEARAANEDNPKKEREAISRLLNRIEKGHAIKFSDFMSVAKVWSSFHGRILFTPTEYELPEKIVAVLTGEMDKYLDKFINGKLTIGRKGYYRFDTLKRCLINLIEKENKINLYGNSFIIREKINLDGNVVREPDFCIIHTVYALQKLGYLQVRDVWQSKEFQRDSFDSNSFDTNKAPTRYVHINVTLEDSFINEIHNQYKTKNPTIVMKGFDDKTGVLKFADQEIALAKKGKETDSVLLMRTLLKESVGEWKFNDEILVDWGYSDELQIELPKNKVYFAGQKINNAIALKTKINDFIECNTTKARINPKYLKVDE